jgi:hypothetical protein
MRLQGDGPADEVVAVLAKTGQTDAVTALMASLMRNDDLVPEALPPVVRDFLATSARALDGVELVRVDVAEKLFELYGPEVLMALGLYALPSSYAAAKGVQVLYRSAYLNKRPLRRVWETTQFVVDVMTSGGLSPTGRGLRTAQKVRLMHAAVRHLVQNDPARPWNTRELGVPINQEDLAATLMTFSFVVLTALQRMGIDVPAEQQEAYLYAWRSIGAIMGVDRRLVPRDMNEAAALTKMIAARQIVGSDQGAQLAASLVEGLEAQMPRGFEGFIASGMRFFLEKDAITGRDVAALLKLPPADWTTILVDLARTFSFLDTFVNQERHVAAAIRSLRTHYVDFLLRQSLAGRPEFRIPDTLRDLWTR